MKKALTANGERFGLLTVQHEAEKKGKQRAVFCICDCGATKTVMLSNLRAGYTKSCGCIQKAAAKASNSTHGLSASREHVSWVNMKARCSDKNHPSYKYYGGRGIRVCPQWIDSFETFLADMGIRPDGMSIDRIDVDGNYEPVNCRWATSTQQANNTRANRIIELDGVPRTLAEACADKGLNYKMVHQRLRRGAAIAEALSA